MTQLTTGAEFAGYTIVSPLTGGYSDCYLVAHPRLPRRDELFILPTSAPADRANLERAAGLVHPNLVPIHDAGEESGQLWVAAAHIPDATAAASLPPANTAEGISPEFVCDVVDAVADALDYVHRHGAVHGGLTTASVLVVSGPRPRVYLGGLGSAAPAGATPDEDQRQLAAVVASMLGGPEHSVSVEVAAVLNRASGADAAGRFATCGEFAGALRTGVRATDWAPIAPSAPVQQPAPMVPAAPVPTPPQAPSVPPVQQAPPMQVHSPIKWAGVPLNEAQIRGLACGAFFPITSGRDAVDSLASTESSRRLRTQIKRSWAITDTDSALQTIDLLAQGLVTPDYDAILPIAASNTQSRMGIRSDAAVVGEVLAAHPGIAPDRIRDVLTAATGSRSLSADLPSTTAAWELAQAVDLVRACATVGLISAEHAWGWIVELGERARSRYPDWSAFAVGFEWGRALASGDGDKKPASAADDSCAQTRPVLTLLFADAASPWLRVPLR